MAKTDVNVAQLSKLGKFERKVVEGTELRISGGTMATTPQLQVDEEVFIVLKGKVKAVDHLSKADGETTRLVRQHKLQIKEAIVLADDAVLEVARGEHALMHEAMFGPDPTLPLNGELAGEDYDDGEG